MKREYRKRLKNKLKKRNYRFFIAEDRGKPVGFIGGSISKLPKFYKYHRRGEIGPIFIRQGYRKKGIGSKLVGELFDWFKSKGIRWVRIKVYKKNTSAISFWKKMGFKEYVIGMSIFFNIYEG
jgi:ribosomal protein S18 acetylase RimI-like enzyme